MARETFTSLKATHVAHRMAEEIHYTPLELHERCPMCGQELQPRLSEENTAICSACNTPLKLPAHILQAMLRREAEHPSEPSPLELEERAIAARRIKEHQRLWRLGRRKRERNLALAFCILALATLAICLFSR